MPYGSVGEMKGTDENTFPGDLASNNLGFNFHNENMLCYLQRLISCRVGGSDTYFVADTAKAEIWRGLVFGLRVLRW